MTLTPHARKTKLQSFVVEFSRSKLTHKIYQITVDGQLYEFATDGTSMLAFRVEKSDAEEVDDALAKAGKIPEYLKAKAQKRIEHNGNSAAFGLLIDGLKAQNCPCCKGSGKRDLSLWNSADEEFLTSAIDPFAELRLGLIDGAWINFNLLAKNLVGLTEFTEPIGFSRAGSIFTFFGADWILVQMGMTGSPEFG